MNDTQFFALVAAIVTSFAWMVGMRHQPRVVRVLGVSLVIGAWLVYRMRPGLAG
jgi:hypothetical protein